MPETSRGEHMEATLEAPADDTASGTNTALKGKFKAVVIVPSVQAAE